MDKGKRGAAIYKAMVRLEETKCLPAEKRKEMDMLTLMMLYRDGYNDSWGKAFPLEDDVIAETAAMDLRVEEVCHPDEIGEKEIEYIVNQ